MDIVFATNNKNKLKEVQEILGSSYSLLTPKDIGITEEIPENQLTIEGNALEKARYIYSKTSINCFADDTGLEVDILNGEPGVRSARYAGDGHDFAANTKLLLRKMEGIQNRQARFKTIIALIIDGKEFIFEGIVKGLITENPSGNGGFGYDPMFIPEGFNKTFAEMDESTKNKISHRGIAVTKLAKFLETTNF